jgi:hypothetical protein
MASRFRRKATRRPDPSLDLLDPLLEMCVARIDIAPRIEDRDHRLATVVSAIETHLGGA